MAETRVRIPVAVLSERPRNRAFRRLRGQGANRSANPTLGGRATSSTFARDNRLLGQPYGFEALEDTVYLAMDLPAVGEKE